MSKLLVVAFGPEGRNYVNRSRQLGMQVRVLDCFDVHHRQLITWYGDMLLQVQGRRSDVTKAVMQEGFDTAIVHEDEDFVRTALITQSLREAGVKNIIVVSRDGARRVMYKRFGANNVVVAEHEAQVWRVLKGYVPGFATA